MCQSRQRGKGKTVERERDVLIEYISWERALYAKDKVTREPRGVHKSNVRIWYISGPETSRVEGQEERERERDRELCLKCT